MEQNNNAIYKNSVEITGNISSIGEIKQKSNGKDFLYINVAQNSRDGKPSYYPVYLDGVMLENFQKEGLKLGDRITAIGKLESYQKDSKQTLQIRPFNVKRAEIEKAKETTQSVNRDNNKEIDM